MKNIKYILLLLLLTLSLTSCFDSKNDEQAETDNENNITEEQTETNLTTNENDTMDTIQTKPLENGDIVAIMKTSTGTIKIKLFTDLVPKTTTNFIGLAKKGYYNDIIFHRVIKGFMIQGGDPTGTGMGGESIYGEKFNDEFNPELKNIPYSISMANAGANTNGSQFFINQVNNSNLDNKHSVFGQVIEGNKNVDKIAKAKTGENDKPEKEIKIISIDIKEYQDGVLKDYEFNLEETLKKLEEDKKIKLEAKKGKAIVKGDIAVVHYTGTLETGEKFDSSLDRGEPIEFEVGAGVMIKGFDAGVVGMKIGEKKTLTLTPSEAYGEYDETKTQVIPKTELKSFTDAGVELVEGGILQTGMGNLKIIKTDDTTVTIDVNHELAGKTLTFNIEIVNIK